jgi:hypothetical protein
VIASDNLLEIKESVSPNEKAEAPTAQQWLKHAPAPPSYGHFSIFSKAHRRVLCSSAHLPCVLLLLQQRRVAAGSGLGNGLGTTITYVRPKLRPATPPRRRYIATCVTLPLCT